MSSTIARTLQSQHPQILLPQAIAVTNQLPTSSQQRREKAKSAHPFLHFIAGGIGGMIGAIFTSPLDVVKTRLQSSYYKDVSMAVKNRSAHTIVGHFIETGRLLGQIYRVEGGRALFKGLGPNLVGVIPARAINFYVYGNGKRFYTELNGGRETSFVYIISAMTAGVVTSTITNPIWLIKTRMQLQSSAKTLNPGTAFIYKNSLDCAIQIIRKEGIKSLYKGLSASLLGVTEGTIQWVVYENLKKQIAYQKRRLLLEQEMKVNDVALQVAMERTTTIDWIANLSAAGAAKLIAACVAYPHEVLRTRLRQTPMENGTLKYNGLFQCLRTVVKEEGVVALYGGMSAHLMRVVPNAAIMFFCYEFIIERGVKMSSRSL